MNSNKKLEKRIKCGLMSGYERMAQTQQRKEENFIKERRSNKKAKLGLTDEWHNIQSVKDLIKLSKKIQQQCQ